MAQTREEIKARKRAWNDANKEKGKAWRDANRDKINATRKAYRDANKEKVAATRKAYHEANKEKIAATRKKYHEANREKGKAYCEANKEKIAARVKAYHKNLADGLVVTYLTRSGIPKELITPEMIQEKRELVKQFRNLKELKSYVKESNQGNESRT